MRYFIVFTILLAAGRSHAIELYFETAERCEKGNNYSCETLKQACDFRDDARACFHLSYSLGNRNEDFEGYSYLKKACLKGLDDACGFLPEIRQYIEEKYASKKVVL